jgi:hypothetical protein
MKKKNIFKKAAFYGVCAAAILSTTSCNDFLTLYPTTQIVEENFWEDKSDLENIVNACYSRLAQADMIGSYIMYGEARSDNFIPREAVNDQLHNMMNANLLPTDGYEWTSFYNEINWCNKILEHGQTIINNDQSFTEGDWKPIEAEMVALRSLSYFYLVRIWRDVPLALKAYNDDSDDFYLGQTPQEVVLDTIINQLDRVKDNAMQKYSTTKETKGYITRKAIYSMLADMYLWRAAKNESADSVKVYGDQSARDYQKCIDCCDYVIKQAIQDKKDYYETQSGFGGNSSTLINYTEKDLLVSNSSTTGIVISGEGAYNSIFGSKNSDESIFELQLNGSSDINNTAVSGYYGFNKDETFAATLVASSLFQDVSTSTDGTDLAYYKTDMRRWENIHYEGNAQANYPLAKFIYSNISQQKTDDNTAVSKDNINYEKRPYSNMNANWIFYRMSDIFLMKAEALSRLHPGDADALSKAFNYVSMVSKRSNPDGVQKGDTIKASGYTTGAQMTSLVYRERQREFLGEGKRWFDLVRMAQREGNTSGMLDLLVRKYDTGAKGIRSKLATLESLFCPVSNEEIKKNSLLHQNPAWKTDETITKQ